LKGKRFNQKIWKRTGALLLAVLVLFETSGCGKTNRLENATQMQEINDQLTLTAAPTNYGSTYEIFVGSFYDSDGDGMGDLKGVQEKLDYINDGDDATVSDLGCNAIWFMPVSKSDSYHKYDVIDYKSIDSDYGTMEDFDELVTACHERGIRVILDMVINHTSSSHPWFVKASEYLENLEDGAEPDLEECPYVDYYHFSREKQEGYAALGNSGWYYEARFWEGMPDLNLDSEAVREELLDVAQYWIDHDVDGFRMDAVLYYYTGNNDKNIEFMNWYNDAVKAMKDDFYIVAEAWTSQDIYSTYYASGFDSYFDFAFAGQDGVIAKTVNGTYSAYDYAKAQVKEQELYSSYQEDYINAPFYTNHDLPRSAGYYAGDDGVKTKFAGGLNLMMSGNAFVYYGEELGMKGSGKDENKRGAMYWTADEDAEGMCDGPVGMDDFEQKFAAYDEQAEDALSIYEYYRNAIRLRSAYPAIAAGRVAICEDISGDEVCVYTKSLDGEKTVIIAVNNTEEKKEVTLTEDGDFTDSVLKDASLDVSSLDIGGVLLTSQDEAKYKDGNLEVPAYGIVVVCEE
jgi:glycosidase